MCGQLLERLLEPPPRPTDTDRVHDPVNPPSLGELSVCVLSGDDLQALSATVAAAGALGHVVVGVPSDLMDDAASVVRAAGSVSLQAIDLAVPVGQAWTEMMAAAPSDLCLLLHAGEVPLAGRPVADQVFSGSIVVEQSELIASPDRLTNVRIVDRRRCRMSGAVRPILEVLEDQALDRVPQARRPVEDQHPMVIVDLGTQLGPVTAAWLHFAARHQDETTDPDQLIDLAQLLASTGEVDGALVRLVALHGALEGETACRAYRLMALLAARHNRQHELELAVEEWQRIVGHPVGPAQALRGLGLYGGRRVGEAMTVLDDALALGLTDDDEAAIDRSWVLTARSNAEAWATRSATILGRLLADVEIVTSDERLVARLVTSWLEVGRPVSDLLDKVPAANRAPVIERLVKLGRQLGGERGLALAQALWRTDRESATSLVHSAAAAGTISVPQALEWSRRIRSSKGASACPLPILAASFAAPAVTRVLAAAALMHDLGDDRGRPLLQAAVLELHPAALDGATRRLQVSAPQLEELLALA